MSEANKGIMRRIFDEVWNQGQLDAIDELFSPDYVAHGLPPQVSPDREGLRQFIGAYLAAFPDIHMQVEDLIAEGDKVVTRITGRGTHQGELMGIPATGNQIQITTVVIARIEGSQNVEAWIQSDQFGLMVQLGVIPPPGQG
jgi:predicted ester cyclase